MADYVVIMYAGRIIEKGTVYDIFDHPMHPYTKALLNTVPTIRDAEERQLQAIPGMVPENYDNITGCRFAERCPYRKEICNQSLVNYDFGNSHRARCIVAKEGGIA